MRIVRLLVRWIGNFEILNGEAGHIVHGDLEVHSHRADFFATLRRVWHFKSHPSNQIVFLTTLELFNLPLTYLFVSLIFKSLALDPFREFKTHPSGRFRHRKPHSNLRCVVCCWEIGSHFNCELHFVPRLDINKGIDAERSRVFAIYTVIHD